MARDEHADGTAAPPAAPPRWWSTLVRRKGHVDSITLAAVAVTACLPILIALSRVVALPGESHTPALLEPLRALGAFLNEHFSFDWVPPRDRSAILFLLLLPTGALLVASFRLVLGVRVLGVRAILLALGFQAIGLFPSLALMLVIVGLIVLVRPWIRRVRLPLYARLAFILGLSAMTLLGALLVAPWLGSEAVWRVAFFPAIITAMFAEGVGKTLEQDDVVMAVWRATWTIVLALLFTLIDGPVSRLSYNSPELVLTQLMAIVLVAEFFDLRLLESWPARISRHVTARPKVAVVRTRKSKHRVASLGREAPAGSRARSIRPHVAALRNQGFEVTVFDGNSKLLRQLARYLPTDRRGTPGGIVLNLATGQQGDGWIHVPALLEIAGIPYTGPGPLAHARLADRFALLTLLRQAEVPVPRHVLVHEPTDALAAEFPAWVGPQFQPDANRRSVRNLPSLRHAVRKIRKRHGQGALVEEMVRGRKISVALLGNEVLECLPLVEHLRGGDGKACPALLDDAIADRIRMYARAAYRVAGCRDYARVDVRVPHVGDPVLIEVKWSDLFAQHGAFVTAAEVAGYGLGTVMRRVVTEAAQRYLAAPKPNAQSTSGTGVVSLLRRRAAV